MIARLSDKAKFLVVAFLNQGLRLMTTLIIARYVTKDDNGRYMLVMMVAGSICLLGDVGIARALVQIRDIPDEEVEDTATVLCGGLGLLYMPVWIVTGAVLWYLKSDWRLMAVGVGTGLCQLLAMVYQVQLTVLNRHMRFGAETWQNLALAVTTAISGLAFALGGLGIFVLVLQPLVAQALGNYLILHRHGFRLPRRVTRHAAGALLSRGGKITVSQFADKQATNLMGALVFSASGTRALGSWGKTLQSRELIGQNISSAFDRLLFPMLTSRLHDPAALAMTYVRGCTLLLMFNAWGGALFMANAADATRVMLGPQWTEVPMLLTALSVTLIATPFWTMGIALCQAKSVPNVWLDMLAKSTLCLLVLVGGFWLAGHGVTVLQVVKCVAVSHMIGAAFFLHWGLRTVGAGLGDACRRLMPIFVGTAAAVAAGVGGRIMVMRLPWIGQESFATAGVGPLLPALARGAVVALVQTVVFVGVIWLVDRTVLSDIRRLMRKSEGAAEVGAEVEAK